MLGSEQKIQQDVVLLHTHTAAVQTVRAILAGIVALSCFDVEGQTPAWLLSPLASLGWQLAEDVCLQTVKHPWGSVCVSV